MGVSLKDFQPINNWKVDVNGPKFNCCRQHFGHAKYIIDETTNRRYLNDSRGVVRFKCFLLTLGTPFVHPITSIVNVAYRTLRLATFSHFWVMKQGEGKYNFKARLADAGKDLLRVVAFPLSIVALEAAALYGMFRPYDGRKLYASLERATYGNFVLAPCFQPDPNAHAFGGNINQKNVF